MERTLFLPTAGLGVAIIVLYGFRCWKASEPLNLAALVNIMLQSGGIVAGLFLVLSTLVPEFKERLPSLDIYIFISGMSVCAVSVQGLKREVFAGAERGKVPSAQALPEGQPMVAIVAATAGAPASGASTNRVA